jgi:alanyl-tRNA synthetase
VDAFSYLAREHVILNSLTELIKGTRPEELPERISKLLQKMKEMEKEFKVIKLAQAREKIPGLIASAEKLGDLSLIINNFEGELGGDELRNLALELREKLKGAVVILSSLVDGRVVLVCATDERSRAAGVKAGELAKRASQILSGGGGGKDDFAQGGGTDVSQLKAAFTALRSDLQKR